MATWNRRKNGYVYVYTYKDGKQVALPRKETKHLDPQPDHNIEAWVSQWSLKNENRTVTEQNFMYDSSKLSANIKSYLSFLRSRGKSEKTVKQHESMMLRFVVPFFLDGSNPARDPQQWPGKSIHMLSWLEGKGISASVIHRCNVSLRGFYRYLTEEGLVQTGIDIKLRNPVLEHKKTPLKTTVTPEAIFSYVETAQSDHLKFIALAGYFFSLRPQEVFALTKSDFRAGSRVQELECAKTMGRIKLYDKFVVNIQKQKTNSNKFTEPKSYSKGWVSCFSEEAAKLLVEILKPLRKDEQILTKSNRELYRLWAKDGIPDVTLKDLRRASLYHLGHTTGIQPIELMKHARHKSLNTTMLYLRRPDEDLELFDELDLEA